jgi:hypothetical protein
MKPIDDAKNYLINKKQIFSQLIEAIEESIVGSKKQIYLKKIKIMEEEIDVIAKKDEWETVLEKARTFFESIEDYEMCQKCKSVQDKLNESKKKKKSNG